MTVPQGFYKNVRYVCFEMWLGARMLDLGGTYRAASPTETLDKIVPMLWEKFGITRVANITGLDDINIPTYLAIRPNS